MNKLLMIGLSDGLVRGRPESEADGMFKTPLLFGAIIQRLLELVNNW